jgi:RimJ/RimL family protein N-acetyltransferase
LVRPRLDCNVLARASFSGTNSNVKDIDLVGPRMRIRRARLDDAESRFRWFSDPKVTEYLPLAGERILPMADVVAFLEKANKGDDDASVSARIELLSGRLIGCGGLRSIVPGESAEVSVVIGEPDVWGLGYGSEAMALLLDFGFEQLELRTIWLIVRAENARAVRLFTRLGFVVVETLEAAVIVRGVARNKLRMELSRDSWRGRNLGR